MSDASQFASSQLADLRRQFQACSAAAEALVASVAEGELEQRPKNQGWSIAECLEHLTATTRLYLPILQSALQEAPAGDGPYKMDWKGRLLKWVLEPPYRSKVKTLPSLEPKIEDVRRVLPDFLASQQQLFEAMKPWSGRALDKALITSPFNKRLRYNIYSLFNVVAAHQRHHLWQAQRVRDQIQGK
jgi:DinB superfamily